MAASVPTHRHHGSKFKQRATFTYDGAAMRGICSDLHGVHVFRITGLGGRVANSIRASDRQAQPTDLQEPALQIRFLDRCMHVA